MNNKSIKQLNLTHRSGFSLLQMVQLQILFFWLEQGYDYVSVHDGPSADSTEVARWSGLYKTDLVSNQDPLQTAFSTGDMTVVFSSDVAVERPGFQLLYQLKESTDAMSFVLFFIWFKCI